jgi:aryl-phospho-beta-D-glucosidase BglC (GH1 family)
MTLLAAAALALLTPPAAAAGDAEAVLWIEAESGAEYSPIVVKADPDASQAIYLASWERGADYSARAPERGLVVYEIEVAEGGYYHLWARLRRPAEGPSFDLSVDGGALDDERRWIPWDHRNPAPGEWAWVEAGEPLYLTPGEHTLRLSLRGPGVDLDKLALSMAPGLVPDGPGGAEPKPAAAPSLFKSDTVARNGQLRVEGGQLVNRYGQPVQLRGAALHGLQWFPITEGQTIPNAASFFGLDIVRPAMYVERDSPMDPTDYWGGYLADPDAMLARELTAIDDAIDAGVYVFIDWHIHSDPGLYTEEAAAFFSEMARRYRGVPNVIYEICNEPVGVSWSADIKPYAEAVIAAIRAHDPDNIVLVGTPNWSQDVDAAAADPLDPSLGPVMYAHHFYAGGHDLEVMKAKVQAGLDAGLAVFVNEWSPASYDTASADYEVAAQWLAFLNQNNLSWALWSLSDRDDHTSLLKPGTALDGPWTEEELTAAGRWALEALRGEREALCEAQVTVHSR